MGFRLAESCLSPQIENDGIISGDLETSPPESSRKTLSKSVEYDSTAVRQHPLGIKPIGNAYTAKENIKVAAGLFATLPDELVVQVLEWFDAVALQQIECTCKVLYAFSRLEDLWRTLLVKYVGKYSTTPTVDEYAEWLSSRSSPSQVTWRGTWRSTYLNRPGNRTARISCRNLFSDILYGPFLCAHTSLLPYACHIPARNSIPRLSDLTTVEFSEDWTDKPFILTAPIRSWPAYQDWSIDTMLEQYSDVTFRAEAVDWPLRSYVDYMNDTTDESPLYLFDRSFVEKMGLEVGMNGQYWPPKCFGADHFSVLGNQRPDCRWLIVGPERSGSTFHKDPNATSAWNAVLKGSKYWIMFPTSPSQPPPPGVFVSEDQSEVTSPLSIAEWLIGFHAEARRTPGCMEGICGEGEVLHVPSGWWHLVVNLETSIAITQNFVPEAHLTSVLAFLKDKPDQVSGFKSEVKNPYELFVRKFEEAHPEILAKALHCMANMKAGKKRKWKELVSVSSTDDGVRGSTFSFGFDNGDDEDIP